MQRVDQPVLDGARRRHQRLPHHLSAEHALPAILRAVAAKQIDLQLFEVEQLR